MRLGRYTRPIVQCLWSLCRWSRPGCYNNGKFRQPAWASFSSLQFKLRLLPVVHGLVNLLTGVGLVPFTNTIIAMISAIFLVCSLRTNIVFVVIFLSFVLAFSCLAGAYWNLALVFENAANTGAAAAAANLLRVGSLG